MMNRSPVIIALGLGVVLAVFSDGCQNPAGNTVEPRRLVPREQSYFADVPLPVGFTLVDKASEDRMTGKRRLYVRHVYEGRSDTFATHSFYIEQMPLNKWTMLDRGVVNGVFTIHFEKGQEFCTVTISRAPGWNDRVRVEVLITQQERGAP